MVAREIGRVGGWRLGVGGALGVWGGLRRWGGWEGRERVGRDDGEDEGEEAGWHGIVWEGMEKPGMEGGRMWVGLLSGRGISVLEISTHNFGNVI